MIFLVHILLRRGLVKCPNTFHRITWGYSLHGNQCFAWKRVKTTVSPTNPELSLQHYLIDWMRLPLYFIYIHIYACFENMFTEVYVCDRMCSFWLYILYSFACFDPVNEWTGLGGFMLLLFLLFLFYSLGTQETQIIWFLIRKGPDI